MLPINKTANSANYYALCRYVIISTNALKLLKHRTMGVSTNSFISNTNISYVKSIK